MVPIRAFCGVPCRASVVSPRPVRDRDMSTPTHRVHQPPPINAVIDDLRAAGPLRPVTLSDRFYALITGLTATRVRDLRVAADTGTYTVGRV